MASPTSKSYHLYIDNTEAEKALKKLQKTASELEKEIGSIKGSGGDATKQLQKLANTKAQIDALQRSISSGLTKSFRDLQNDCKKLENQLKRATDPKAINLLNGQLEIARKKMLDYQASVLKVESAQKKLSAETRGAFGSIKDYVVGNFLGGGLTSLVENAIGQVKSFLTDSLDAAIDADQAVSKFQATLDNAGKGESFDRYAESAKRMKDQFDFLDDEDILGVFDKLLIYGKLTEKQIREITPVIIDFAYKQGISLEEASGVVIKALEGQAKGLKEYGINIKDAGSETERYNVIMTDLAAKVNGATAAFGESARGDIALTKQQIADLKEEIGEGLLPVYRDLLSVGRDVIAGLKEANNASLMYTIQLLSNTDRQRAVDLSLDMMKDTNSLTVTSIQQFTDASFEDQKRLVEQNEALVKFARQQVEKLEQQGIYQGEAYTRAVAQLVQDKKILDETKKIFDLAKGEDEFQKKRRKAEEDEKKAEKDREAAEKKAQSDREAAAKRLAEFLRKNAEEIGLFNKEAYEKEIAQVHNKYLEMEKLAKGNAAAEKTLAEQKAQEIGFITRRTLNEAGQAIEEGQKQLYLLRKQKDEKSRAERQEILERSRNTARGLTASAEQNLRSLDTARIVRAELAIRKAALVDRLKAEKNFLLESERQEKNQLELSYKAHEISYEEYQARLLEIDQNFRETRFEKEIQFYSDLMSTISAFADVAVSIYDEINTFKSNQENAELERDRRDNDEKKKNLQKQLDGRIISRATYDKQVAILDRQLEAKEKALKIRQFQREKQLNIVKAIIGTAQAVVQALTAGPIIGAILAGLYGALGAAQIATIASQKPPEMGHGGITDGPSHENGGMPVINPETGRTQAYLEGGEGILRKRAMRSGKSFTLSGTPSQIASTLNGLYGGITWDRPAQLVRNSSTYRPTAIDYPGLNSTISNVRQFATGGQYVSSGTNSGSTTTAPAIDPIFTEMLLQNTAATTALRLAIENGIRAWVPLSELNDQQQRMDDLRNDTTFR